MLITTLRLCVIGSSLCRWNLPVSASAPEEVGVFIMADGGFAALWRPCGGLVMPYDMTCTNAMKRLFRASVSKSLFSSRLGARLGGKKRQSAALDVSCTIHLRFARCARSRQVARSVATAKTASKKV